MLEHNDIKWITLVAALIWKHNSFLICQLSTGKARALMWEFVGGKVEPGESFLQGFVRHRVLHPGPARRSKELYIDLVHAYPDVTVHLSLYNASIISGEIQMLEHNDIKWITPQEIRDYAFCPADKTILEKIEKERGSY